MPPKGNTSKQKKGSKSEPSETKESQQPQQPPSPQSSSKRRYEFLRMYRAFTCCTNYAGFFNANEAYMRKIGAYQKHRIDRYYVKIERNPDWKDKLLIFRHMEKFKRLRKISFYIGQKTINQGKRLPQQVETLQRFRKSLKRFTHLSKIEFIYPNKLSDIISLKHIGNLNHLTFGLDIADVLKDENERSLISVLTRDFAYHHIRSTKFICYGAPGGSKKTKKGGKGKPKKGKGKAKATEEPEDEPLDYLTPEYNNFTKIQSLSLDCKEAKIFTAFKGLLATGIFTNLKSLSIAVPDGGFTIQDKSNIVVDSALSLIGLLEGKAASGKGGQKASSKPDITIKNYENALKSRIKEISNLGNVNKLVMELAKSKEGEIKEIFKNVPNLKELSVQFSPQADWQVKEMYEGIKSLNGLKSLELYLKNYQFSKDCVNGIFGAVVKHAGYLTKFCIGFDDVDHINDTVLIMDTVMKLPNSTLR